MSNLRKFLQRAETKKQRAEERKRARQLGARQSSLFRVEGLESRLLLSADVTPLPAPTDLQSNTAAVVSMTDLPTALDLTLVEANELHIAPELAEEAPPEPAIGVAVQVNIPRDLRPDANGKVTATINISDAKDLESADISFSYNPNDFLDLVIDPQSNRNDVRLGSSLSGGTLVVNLNAAGSTATNRIVTIAAAVTSPRATGSGSLIEIDFVVRDLASTNDKPINLRSVSLNEGEIPVSPAPTTGTDVATDGLVPGTAVTNPAPTDILLSNNSVAENQGAGIAVGNLSAVDNAGDSAAFALVAGTGSTDNASFQIVGNQLHTNAIFDFETKNSYSIRVQITDGANQTFQKVFTVNVTNVNEQPTDIALSNNSVAENSAVGTAVGNFSATDPDAGDTQSFTLVAGTGSTDNASFQIVGNQLRTNAIFDFETKSSYSIRVRATDNGTGNLSFEKVFTVNVTDVVETVPNQPPSDIVLPNNSVAENQAVGTSVGNLSATDPDAGDTHTFALVAGTGSTDNASFQIVGNQLRTNAVFDFETKNSYSIRVRATDSGTGNLTFEKVFTVNVTNVNEQPTDITLSNNSVAENSAVGTAVGNLSATDPDVGDTFTFSLVAGTGSTDNGSFQIVGNQLRTNAVFDFETKNSFSIRVRATDSGTGNLIFEKVFAVSVTNVNEQPTDIALSNNSVAENQPVGTPVGNLSATDPDAGDTQTFTLVAGTGSTDNGSFQIVGNQLRTNASFDFETKNSYSIRVRTTDVGGLSFEKVFTINVTDVNETVPNQQPTDIALSNNSVAENQAPGAAVGNLSATDPDAGDTHTFTLVAGTGSTDNGAFQIVGNQLRTNASFDFETKSSFSLRVRATDAGGLSFEKVFTVNVTNVNEQPTDIALSNNSVAENSAVGSAVGNFSATDPDAGDTQTFTLVAGTGSTDNASFQIVGNQLRTNASLDFETKNSYSIRVRATDAGGQSFEKVFTINVTNVNEQPTDVALSSNTVAENQPVGTPVGNLSATDPDAGDTQTFTLVAGTGSTDNGSFQIVGNQLRTNASFDFETKNSYSIRVRTTDAGGLSFEKVFTINVTDVNETIPNQQPTDIALSNNSVAENQATGTAVGNLTATDPDVGDTHTFTLVAGTGSTDNGSFQIVGNQLRSNASFDFEAKSSFSVRIRATDAGGLSFEKVFTVNVTNVNEQPTDIALSNNSVAENQAIGTPVGNLSAVDPEAGDTQTFTLVAGTGSTDNGSFQIVGNQLRTNASFDFETKNSYSIRVRTTDAGGLSFEKVFTVNVTDVNETIPNQQPTDIALSNNSVAENQAVGTAVGNLTATDPDAGDTHTFTLVAGTGSTDNGSFQIVGNQLRTNASLNFEVKNSFSIRVRATDSGTGNLSFEKVFTVNVNNVNEQPSVTAATFNLSENSANGTAVGTVVANDPDAGQTLSFSITDGNTNGAFEISPTGVITVANGAALNFETTPQFLLTVQATDNGNPALNGSNTITVNVTDRTNVDFVQVGQGSLIFVAPNGTTISANTVATPPGAPANASFPVGFFTLTLTGVAAGGSADVDLVLPSGVLANSFFKFGPEAGNPTSHYYEYLFNGTTGAEILSGGSLIRLHFVDGARGDFDLAANGTITDPGAPSLVTVDPNNLPVANNDARNSFNLKEDTALIVSASRGVLSNDTDADGDTLTAKLAGASSGGQSANDGRVVLNANGSFTYTPKENFFGTDTFTYVANDGKGDDSNSNIATVTVVVTPVNDAPLANTDNYTVTNPTVTFTRNAAQGVLSNDTDADNNSLTAQLVSGPQFASSFTLNPDGSFSYRVDLEDLVSNNVTDSFTYRANDGTISGNTATVFLNIQSLALAARETALSVLGAGPEVAQPIVLDEPTVVGDDSEGVPFLTSDIGVQKAEAAPVTNSLENNSGGLVLDTAMSASLTEKTGKEWLFFTTIN